MEGPRRKSIAGPVLVAATPKRSFQVTNTYIKGQEKGIEGMLKTAQASQELIFDGNLTIESSLETNQDILCCKYTEDQENLAVGFTDGMIRLFKTHTSECIQTMFDTEIRQTTAPVTSIQHRPVSKNYPITNSITCTYANGCVKSWNYNFGQCVYTIREKRQTYGVTYHPRLPKFVTYGDDMKIYLYDEESRTQERILSARETTKDILCCKYTEDLEHLAVGFTDGMIRLFKTNTAECIQTMSDTEIQQDTAPVTSIQHRPVSQNYPITNCLTCTYANGFVKSWNYNFGQCIFTIREKRQTYGVSYHPRLPKFVTYGDDMKIYLYDEESRTQERILSSSEAPGAADGHVSRVFAACFNPRSNHELITGGWDDVVLFWDLRQPHALRRISGLHLCGEGLDISPKGTEILTCAWQKENTIQLWDYGTGGLIVTIEPDVHESLLYCGKFINKDYAVVGGTDKNLIRIIDLHTYVTASSIVGLQGGVYSVDIGPLKKIKKVKESAVNTKGAELAALPKIAFCSGKRIYQIDHS